MNSSLERKQQVWSARFNEPVSALVKRYTASVAFDRRLAMVDIRASLAHAQMLCEASIIGETDLEAIRRGLAQIADEVESDRFAWSIDLEDVHLNIELRLSQLVGDAGKRLHTARSRNDQVATDLRLWLREAIDEQLALLRVLQSALVAQAAQHTETVMPGFTHLQIAQPVSFAHHLMAYVEMFARDEERLREVRARVNRLPLGAAALAGTGFPIRRERVAELLGFEALCANSLDAVSDRDFAIEYCAAAALLAMHISRLSEELIVWMSPGMGLIDLPDRFCTGSSIMPQKKNPDVPELARGKTGRIFGHLLGLLTLMKGQPLAYNKDNQEDKEPLFDTADTVRDTLLIFAELVAGLQVKADRMRSAAGKGYSTATDLADYLVRKGMAFRDAHEAVAHAVRFAEHTGRGLEQLSLEELKSCAGAIDADVFAELTLEGSMRARAHPGGTAPSAVRQAIAAHQNRLAGAAAPSNLAAPAAGS
jgi:argininosuccinate lyase